MNRQETQRLETEKQQSSGAAAQWFAKLRSGSMEADESLAFHDWLEENPENARAYEQCEQAWDLLDDLKDDADIEAYLSEDTVTEPATVCNDLLKRLASTTKGSLWSGNLARAAAVAIVAIGIGLVVKVTAPSQYETVIGEQRLLKLSDGSTVFLNTNTHVSVNYSRQRRQITLENGEAIFTVAHNKKRPFEVIAGNRITRAVGTAFNVALTEKQVTVSVLEGIVELDDVVPPAESKTLPRLTKGQELDYVIGGETSAIRKANLARIQAIRQGKVVFEDERLSDVIKEYNRYSKKNMLIGSAELSDIRVSGTFHINDTQSLLFILEESFGIQPVDKNTHIILLPRI